jgi:hypothetical protein
MAKLSEKDFSGRSAPDPFKKGSLHNEVSGSEITDLALNRGLQPKAAVGPVVRTRVLGTGAGNDALAGLQRTQNVASPLRGAHPASCDRLHPRRTEG